MGRISFRAVLVGAACGLAIAAGLWALRRIPVDVPSAPDYARGAAWLCRPGRDDPCSRPTTATVFTPDGQHHAVTYAPDPAAPIDCFYVYPTVSRVRAAYAPIGAGAQEDEAARNQAARFGTACRVFAPLYRQVTLVALPLLFGGRRGVTIDVPYADVRAAWRTYLATDNHGRGVVLIGHSQGARLLARLIAEEIDGKPVARQLVSAILPGTQILVPESRVVGGRYTATPLCGTASQTGCIIAYSSYPDDRPMPADARYGVSPTPGQRFACVDPRALLGADSIDAELPLSGEMKTTYGTDGAEVLGILTSACKKDGPFSYLAVGARADTPAGVRTKAMLDMIAAENPPFGLHVLDVNLALGSLVEIVHRQGRAFMRR